MKKLGLLPVFSFLALALSFAQDPTTLLNNAPSDPAVDSVRPAHASRCIAGSKLGYYLTETYFNPSLFTAPAFRAGIRMANPPGKGVTRYPLEWRQGAEAFGRNNGG